MLSGYRVTRVTRLQGYRVTRSSRPIQSRKVFALFALFAPRNGVLHFAAVDYQGLTRRIAPRYGCNSAGFPEPRKHLVDDG